MKKETRIIIALTVFVLILLGLLFYQWRKTQDSVDLTNAVTDELDVRINKKGQETASIKIIRAETEIALMKLQAKDTIIKWLQETVKGYKGALNTAIVLRNQTSTKGVSRTEIIYDTIYGDDGTKEVNIAYKTNWSNKWEQGYIKATKDSIYRDIKVINDYQITLGGLKNGWFKKKEYEIEVLNLNPNTVTKELRTFQIKSKPKILSFGVQAGYGIGLRDFKTQPYIGVGVQLNLIGIK